MRKLTLSLIAIITCTFTLLCSVSIVNAYSASDYVDRNPDTGYEYMICDEGDYLSDKQEEQIALLMYETTAYCNALLVTTDYHTYSSTENFAIAEYESIFGKNSTGVVFVIDRYLNEIYLASEGGARKNITNSKCDIICDNTYIYATSQKGYNYSKCCQETFQQVNMTLEGGSISQPMKYISNIFLALALGMFICFLYALYISKSKRPSNEEFVSGSYTKVNIQNPKANFIRQTRKYSPQNSGSHHGGGHIGGGRIGGGHSGGGHHI